MCMGAETKEESGCISAVVEGGSFWGILDWEWGGDSRFIARLSTQMPLTRCGNQDVLIGWDRYVMGVDQTPENQPLRRESPELPSSRENQLFLQKLMIKYRKENVPCDVI